MGHGKLLMMSRCLKPAGSILPVLLALLLMSLLFSGCSTIINPTVHGSGFVQACGVEGEPAGSSMMGHELTWIGSEFTALEDGVVMWVEVAESDLVTRQGSPIDGWMVVAVDPDADPGPEVLSGSATLVRYESLYTSVQVGSFSQNVGGAAGVDPNDRHLGLEGVELERGQRVLVYTAAVTSVPSLAMTLRWTGCAQASAVEGGRTTGGAIGWGDLDSSAKFASAGMGAAVADRASYSGAAGEAVVLAMRPPDGEVTLVSQARLETSRGLFELEETPRFFVHDSGHLQYEVTHAGGPGGADHPLVVWIQIPIHGLEGTVFLE